MHGIIFASLYDYGRAQLGPEASEEIFEGRFFSMSDAHPDEEFVALLARTGSLLQLSDDELLHQFGAFTAEQTFARLYPAFFEMAGDTRKFLLTIENRIHELVRATIPNATPPALSVHPLDPDRVEILYRSPRRLCRLLEGLVVGTGHYYNEAITITEEECMSHGAAACRFFVTAGSRELTP